MSHVVSIKTELTDLAAIKEVCKELGLTFKENQKTYRWWGTSVGDYPIPEGMTAEELGHCDHAIEVPGASFDVGLVKIKGAKGWRLVYDFYGSQGRPIVRTLGQNAERFIQLYGVNKATLEAKRKGHTVNRVLLNDGTIRLNIGSRSW